jgi:hypothetical protein
MFKRPKNLLSATTLAMSLGVVGVTLLGTHVYAKPPPPGGGGGGGIATEIEECQVIDASGPYVVVNDLPGPGGLLGGGSCLELAADQIDLDLGSHVIDGVDSDSPGDGITDASNILVGIHIHHGTIKGFFGYGIKLDQSIGVVEHLNVSGNFVGIFTQGSVVSRNRVEDNRDWGIVSSGRIVDNLVTNNGSGEFGDAGIKSSGGRISGNHVFGTDGIGIEFLPRGVVTGNVSNSSTGNGFQGTWATVTGNTAWNNDGVGLFLSFSVVSDNVANENVGDGFRVSNSTVTNNVAWGNGEDGFGVDDSTFTNNTANNNTVDGFNITCPSNVIGNTALGNGGVNLNFIGDDCTNVNNMAPLP